MDSVELAGSRLMLERQGIAWNKTVTVGTLMAALDEVTTALRAETAARVELEKRVAGMQATLDHTASHALKFLGDFQLAAGYSPGSLVRHRGAAYAALREISPGKAEPGRQGSGWAQVS